MGSAKAQGALWGAGAREWSQLIEPCQVPFYEAAFDAMGLGRGMTFLDAGCGSGLALELATKRGVRPTGLDASEGLLDIARERVAADLHQGDLEEMPFADDTFDAVSAFNSVQFAADPVRAVSEMARVAKPGAPIAVITWAAPDRCEMGVVLGSLAAMVPPPPPGTGGPFALSAPGAVESVVESAGLNSVDVIEVATPFSFSDVDTGVRALLATGPGRRASECSGEDATRAAVVTAFARFARPDGSVVTNNVFRVIMARA